MNLKNHWRTVHGDKDEEEEEAVTKDDDNDTKMPTKMKKATLAKKPTKTATKPKTPKAKQW